jgi:chromate transporter
MKELWELFITFAKIGSFTFGGGYAMLPMLQKEVVENKKWETEENLMDYYAVGQCTPGVIAVNTATFVGYKQRGIIGAISATLGVIAPSLVIIMIIAAFVNNFAQIPVVQHALAGVRVCVCVLVCDAVIKLAKKSLVDAATYAIFAAVMILALFTNTATYLLVIAAGVAGVLIKVIMEKRIGRKGERS